ncbi:AEC family transporter [Nitratireductor sp. XY-223]|uniref:AEC family transporter n=1 Tax=Nitratireductor sp. XY-223 TaxID=2561926 RepID=UPI0010AA66D8|nr:AEC family transporter [Nitratireductor sp. XY-223]
MSQITALILPLFGLIFLGYVTARLVRQPSDALGWLNIFVLYLALPALFFKLLSRTPIEELARFDFILASLLSTYSIFAVVFALAIILARASIAAGTIQGLAAAYGNIGYMGPSLAILAFGEQAAVPVALIFCFENIMHFAIVPCMMAISGSEKHPLPTLALLIARRIVLHPFILATMAGIAVAWLNLPIPDAPQRLIDYLSQAAAPCALFAMGVTLALRPLRRMPLELTYIVPAKLVAHPLLVYLAMGLVGDFDSTWIFTAVLLASLPTATNVFVLAQQYNVWVERASATVLITTVLSVITVSSLLYAITAGLLPADVFPAPGGASGN